MISLLEIERLKNESIFSLLISFYGIGKLKAKFICKRVGFSKNLKSKHLSYEQKNKLIKVVSNLNKELTSDSKKSEILNLKKAILIKFYKGFRKGKGLPVRGQRTRSNAKTSKKRLSKNLKICKLNFFLL